MSTKTSADMPNALNRSSTRRFAPPGGASTFSFNDGSQNQKPAAAPAVVTKPVDENEIKVEVKAASKSTFGAGIKVCIVYMDDVDGEATSIKKHVLTALKESGAEEAFEFCVIDDLQLPSAAIQVAKSQNVPVIAIGNPADKNYEAVVNGLTKADHSLIVVPAILGGGVTVPSKKDLARGWVSTCIRLVKMSKGELIQSTTPALAFTPENPEIQTPFRTVRGQTALLVTEFRESLRRHGCRGIIGLGRKFRIMDDDGSGSLDLAEFTKAVKEHSLVWSDEQIAEVFGFFDRDGNATIDYNEFLLGVRGPLNDRRRQLVLMAFECLDKDRNGVIELSDIQQAYDTSKHPDVLAGRRTSDEVLMEFLETFEGGTGEKDGKVTPDEFCEYYTFVSSSIDEDDYFELMIRNAWHISGGTGWSANSTCKRVLVLHSDGRKTVEEIKNDLGIKEGDREAYMANLKAQGIDAVSIDLFGSMDTTEAPANPAGKPAAKRAPAAGKAPTPTSGSGSGGGGGDKPPTPSNRTPRQAPGGNSTFKLYG